MLFAKQDSKDIKEPFMVNIYYLQIINLMFNNNSYNNINKI